MTSLRIDPGVLERQAIIAAEHGNTRLAANLRRAAELARLPLTDATRVSDALRSRHSPPEDLTTLAMWLDAHDCPLNAALARETRDARLRTPTPPPAAT